MNFRNHRKTNFDRINFKKNKQQFKNSRQLVSRTDISSINSYNLDRLNGEFFCEFNQRISYETNKGMRSHAKRNLPEATGFSFRNVLLFINPMSSTIGTLNFVKTMMFDRLLMSKVEVSNSVHELRKIKDGSLVLHISSLDKKIGDVVDFEEEESVMHKSAYDSRSDQNWFSASRFMHKFLNMRTPQNEHVVRAHIEGVGDSSYIGLKSGVNSVHNLSLKVGETEGLCAIRLDSIPDEELRRLKYCSISNTFLIPEDFLGGKVEVERFMNVSRENFSRVNYVVTAFQGVATALVGLTLVFIFSSMSHLLITYLKYKLIYFLLKKVPFFRNLFPYKFKVGDFIQCVKQSTSQYLSNILGKAKKVFSIS